MNIQCVNSEEIVYTIHITNNVLKQWQDLKQSHCINFSYVEILNIFLSQNHAIIIKKDCTRIEERLRRLVQRLKGIPRGKGVGLQSTLANGAKVSQSVMVNF